jgi:hypothetical protein
MRIQRNIFRMMCGGIGRFAVSGRKKIEGRFNGHLCAPPNREHFRNVSVEQRDISSQGVQTLFWHILKC